MKRRDKLILSVLIGVLVLAAGWQIVNLTVLKPLAKTQAGIDDRREQLDDLDMQNALAVRYRRQLQETAGHTFGSDPAAVQEAAKRRLRVVARAAGLGAEPEFSSVSPQTVRRDEVFAVGWNVEVAGPLEQLINYLYLVRQEPFVHRLEGVSVERNPTGPGMRLGFEYRTLVLPNVDVDERPAEDAPIASLIEPTRQHYNLIAMRDVFRPFVPVPPPPAATQPVAATQPAQQQQPTTQPQQPPLARFRVTGLSRLGPRPQDVRITIVDTQTNQQQEFSIGDRLQIGQIMAVDFSDAPIPGSEVEGMGPLYSSSRLIVRVGSDFWAVELGQSLHEKRILTPEQLPERIRPGT